jgi:hypothetical protein
MTIRLDPALERLIRNRVANSDAVSVESFVARAVRAALESNGCAESQPDESARDRPVWEEILENMSGLSPEELAVLPQDGAAESDHYVYGLPKRSR